MIQTVEMIINSYRIGLVDFLQDFESCDYKGDAKSIKEEKDKIVVRFNTIVKETIDILNTDCNTQLSPDLTI